MEDLIRSVYRSKELDRRYGTSVQWAKQTDVPGQCRFLAQVLARSGIKLLQIGANNGVRGLRAPLVFWWEAPDGSRILTQLTAGYGWGWSNKLLRTLEGYRDYPYDAFLALYVTGDNVGPGDLINVAREAESLGKRYLYPKIQIGNVEDFADYMTRRWGKRIPLLKKELADWWIHGVASQARPTARARWAREALRWSETLTSAAVLRGLMPESDYPAESFREGYTQSLLYSEHTWGIAGFKPKPKPASERDLETNPAYEPMKHSWRVKASYAKRAAELARSTLDRAVETVARWAAPSEGGLVVFNFLSWPRSGVVRIPAEVARGIRAFRAAEGGPELPVQMAGDEAVFQAPLIPACGYCVFVPVRGLPRPVVRGAKPAVENEFYRLEIGPGGEVRSLRAKKLGLELLDRSSRFALNQFIYEGYAAIKRAGWHGSPYKGPGTGKVVPRTLKWYTEEGPVCSRLVVAGTLRIPGFPVQIGEVDRVVRTITLWRGLNRIDCSVRLEGKKETAVVEAGHVAFPFKVPDFRFKLELLGAPADPVEDIQTAGNRDTFAVQHWVDVSGPSWGVTWATVDAPLVSVGDIRIFSWDDMYVPRKSHIYSSVFNNGWSTNFCEFQGGSFLFRYAFAVHQGNQPRPQFGWEADTPLEAHWIGKGEGEGPARFSFFEVSPSSVILLNVKRAEDGRRWIFRLYETCGKKTEATLKFGLPLKGSARLVRLTEEEPPGGAKPLRFEEGKIHTVLGAFEVQTIAVSPVGSGRS